MAVQPSTEKVHQIIARTAMFVSKHGGQSEIILRVKQGDNPTFGFLMPDHHLHSYFRFLVEHPELLHSEYDGKSQEEGKKVDSEHHNVNGVGEALSLLGSVYGSGEEEDGDDNAKTEKDVSQDNSNTVNNIVSHGSKKRESNADAAKDESVSRNTIRSIKEKVLSVKKNSLITASKSGSVKGIRKEGKSGSFSSAAENAKSSALAMASKIEPFILEPPSGLKSLIDKLVEFIMRNGKQFEATLIEQDSKHGRFPFLLPSNQYHPYYLKVLQTAQEAKTNGKNFYSGKDDLVGRGIDRKASLPKDNDFSSLDSAVGDIPLESDRKEKFKMVIGNSKKEAQETQSKGTQQECGITVDAAAAAAIIQAAIRGIDDSNLRTVSSTPLNVHSHVNGSEGNQPASFGSLLLSQPENAGRNGSLSVSALASKTTVRSSQAAREIDCSEAHLTEEQKVKAERLKRAKMFVAMLKSGAGPFKGGASRSSSVDPLESGSRSASEVNLTGKEREGSLAPTDVERPAIVEKPERFYFGEEHNERLARRKYRSRSGGCEEEDVNDDDDDDANKKKHNEGRSRAKYRSRSRRPNEDDENENGEEMEQKHYRRRHRSYSSSDENEDEEESNEEDRDHEHSKVRHRSHHSQHEDDGREEKYKEIKDHKPSTKKHRSHHSSRKRRSSKQCSHEEDEHDNDGRDHEHSRKKHRSHRSSYHSREKHRHRNKHSSRDRESRGHLKHDSSSDDEHQNPSSSDKRKKEFYEERDELEEGEISSRVSEESRGIASGHVSRETSVDVLSSHQRAPSQPSETTAEIPDDLRAKIRAMLMATRL